MTKKYLSLSFLFSFLFFTPGFAQHKSVVSVNYATGAANVVIPVYEMHSGQVSLPISLAYSGNGVRPKDVEGTAGMGWNLQAGGQITRQLRGLPDDCIKDNSGNARYGWLSSSNGNQSILSTLAINNDGSTCSYETEDINNINTYFSNLSDTEPDIFNVNAPGLSCQLIYDQSSGKFKPISYQDIVITETFNSSTALTLPSAISSFTITTDKGIKYVFSAPETVTQTATSGSPNFFKTQYQQYQYGITYYDNWQLTSITDPDGSGVILSYAVAPSRTGINPILLYIGGSTTATSEYSLAQTVTPQTLTNIQTTNHNYSSDYLSFSWTTLSNQYYTNQTVISTITGSGRSFQFNYSPTTFSSSTVLNYVRSFLRSFTDAGCSTPVNYQFTYAGETGFTSGGITTYSTTLPDSSSTNLDYWGYYSGNPAGGSLLSSVYVNPSNSAYQRYQIKGSTSVGSDYAYTLSHTDRSVDATAIVTGALTSVTYAEGGSTTITYEPNDYLDVPSNTTAKGGGIRVSQLTDYDGINTANNIVTSYSYLNPSTSLSSGKPISLPAYAFTIPYSGSATGSSLWAAATAISAYDLSDEDHTVMYGYVTESQTGAGSTVLQFYNPATNWDAAAAPACYGCTTSEWAPTINYAGRGNCSYTYGPIKNDIGSYPFVPNANYEFERGMLQKMTKYNSSGAEVAESDYSYVRSYTPSYINALRFEDNINSGLTVRGYGLYRIYYNTSELSYQEVKKVYNSGTPSLAQSSTTTYTYGSANHKLVTQKQVTNSDGTVLTSLLTYTKDYTSASSGSNANVSAIYGLQQENINAPVETYQQIYNGSTTKTTSASLTLFKAFSLATAAGSVTEYLPSQQLKFIQPDGVTDFSPYAVNGSAQTSVYDSRYFPVTNYDIYDNTGYAQTIDDNHKHVATTVIDHSTYQPVANFSNAAYNEIAFNDFDSDQEAALSCSFTPTGGSFSNATSSHSGQAVVMSTALTLSNTLNKNALTSNYIFSIWINNTSGSSGSINISINGGTAQTLSYSSASGWHYLEKNISLSGVSGTSSYTVSFTTSQTISIDDILFYPDVSQASTATYDQVSHYKLSETNTNGISTYYSRDQWGRLLYVYDQDHNIIQKTTYTTNAQVQAFNPSIYVGNTIVNVSSSFSVLGYDACADAGMTVDWAIGGTTIVSGQAIATAFTHTFTSTGTYTVTATVHSPLFGTKTTSYSITITNPPPANVSITYNSYTLGNGDVSSITFTSSTNSYTKTNADLVAGFTIPQGSYSVSISLSDGAAYNTTTGLGYRSINLNGDCNSTGSNYVSSNNYTLSINLSTCTTLNVLVSQYGYGD